MAAQQSLVKKFKFPPILSFALKRSALYLAALFVIITIIYWLAYLTPATERVMSIAGNPPSYMSYDEQMAYLEKIADEYGYNDPFFVQYSRWLTGVIENKFSAASLFGERNADMVAERLPVTIELLVFTMFLYIPGALLLGVLSGWNQNGWFDRFFRQLSFITISIPPFILGIFVLSIFYTNLGWFIPGRYTGTGFTELENFVHYTRLISVDGFLNGRPDISIDGIRRLVMPVVSLSLSFLGTLLLVTRRSVVDELGKDYIVSAIGRGIPTIRVLFIHVLRNAVLPSITTVSTLITSMLSELYIIERIFNRHGLSELMFLSMRRPIDIDIALGFAIFNFIFVVSLMFVFDMIKAMVDPRISVVEAEEQ